MHWLKRQQKTFSISILSTLFVVAILSVLSMCCGFSNQKQHHTSSGNTFNGPAILCTDSLPSQSPCHTEKDQNIAVLPQARDEEVDGEISPKTDSGNSFAPAGISYVPPELKYLPLYLKSISRPQRNKLLITQLPRAHLG